MKFLLQSLILLPLLTANTFAANHYIRAGASGARTGASWTDAYTDIPSTLVRGDTYYIAAGAYGAHSFPQLAGTTYVYLKMASAAVNGSDPGWNAAYATGQAVFSSSDTVWNVAMSYLDVDGLTGSGTSGYGIHLNSSATTDGPGAVEIDYNVPLSSNPSNLNFRHVEMNNGPWGNGNGSRVFTVMAAGCNNILISHCYLHGGRVWVNFGGGSGNIVEYSYLQNAGSDNGSLHCAGFTLSSVNNFTIRYCVMENMMGSANTTYIEPQANPSGVYVYGNIIKATSASESTSQGAIAITSTDVGTDIRFYNNTIYGLHGALPGIWGGNVTGSTVYVTNNIWQNCSTAPNFTQCMEGNNIKNTGAVSFVNAANGDFHLAGTTAGGAALPAPYNMDPDGKSRSATGAWSVGAYAFGTAVNLAPVVSPITQNLADADPVTAGLQVLAGATVQCSGSATDPNSDPLTWQWLYAVNGGAQVVLQSGAGVVPTISYTYPANSAGSTYVWTLLVSDGKTSAQSQLTVGVIAAAANQPPVVSAISQNVADVDAITAGMQVFAGTTVQCSATATDPNGDQLTWQWLYAVNGGAQTVFQSGAGTVAAINYTYPSNAAGSSYVWTLAVNDGKTSAQSQLTVGVKAVVANQPPVVAAIGQNASDIDPAVAGMQIYVGTVVRYSGSASDPNGDPLTWQWIYTLNGGPEVVFQSGSGTVAAVSFSYGAGTAGNTYLWKLRVSDGKATAESQLAVGVEATPVVSGGLSFQATDGVLTAPFVITNGAIYQPVTSGVTDGGQALFNFTVTNAGNYVVLAVVDAPGLTANSFYLNMDAQPQDPLMSWDILPTTGSESRLASWRGNGTPEADQFVPQVFTLANGPHQLIIRGRESGTMLYSLLIIKEPSPPQNFHIVASQ